MRNGNFDVRFLGNDYRSKPITDASAIETIYYTDRSHGKSTSSFKEKLL
jgi:glycerol-3-phosphate cytidylyltransferase